MPTKLILFGLPGSGKDTQASRLSERLGLPVFSMGDLLREEAARGTELGRIIAPCLAAGTIVPNGVAGQIMRERILSSEAQRTGYVCVNYPRSLGSFEQYLTWDRPTAVVVLDVPEDTACTRLLARGRADDTREVIGNRVRSYAETNVPLYAWLATTNVPVCHVDGTKPVEAVTDEILACIQRCPS